MMARFLMGLTRRRRILSLAIIALIIILIFYSSMFHHNAGISGSSSEVICDQDDSVKQEMADVFRRSVASLRSLQLQPFLCYDSLWSALNSDTQSFAWKTYNEICLRNEDVSKIEEAAVIRAFQRQSLNLVYFSSTGEYEVSNLPSGQMRVKIILFEKDAVTKNMRRVGWKHRLIPPDSCALIHCFPPHLLHPPLPAKSYYKISIPVPRDEIEIQKYHYPDDWWKSNRDPKECVQHQLSA
jgi:hypothetical protein